MKRFNKIFFVILTMLAGVTMLVFNNAKQNKVVVNELKNDMKFDDATEAIVYVAPVNKQTLINYGGPFTITVSTGLQTCSSVFEKAKAAVASFYDNQYGKLFMTDIIDEYETSWCAGGDSMSGVFGSSIGGKTIRVKGIAVRKAKIYASINNASVAQTTYDFKVLNGEDINTVNMANIAPYVNGYDYHHVTVQGAISTITSLKQAISNSDYAYLNAFYTPGACTVDVTYDGNGGKVYGSGLGYVDSLTYSQLSTDGYRIPETVQAPSKGYFLDGWYTQKTGGTKVQRNDEITNCSNHSIYARWKTCTVTITYDGNGGKVDEAGTGYVSSTAKTGETTDGYRFPNVSRPGYVFDGWYTQKNGGDKLTSSQAIEICGDHTVYAHWSVKSITITYDANGGVATVSSQTAEIVRREQNTNENYKLPTSVTREGYTFVGWYTKKTDGYGSEVNSNMLPVETNDHTLYAHWQSSGITVTLNLNASDASFPSGSSSTKTVYYGGTYGTMPTPRRTGYEFKGWYDAATGGNLCQDSARVTNASNHTLYAHWQAISMTVSFNPNDGVFPSGQSSTKTVTFDSTYGSMPTVERTGYDFAGWYDAASGGTQVTESTKVKETTNHALFAHWTPKKYTVTFNPNEGSLSSSSSSTKQVTYKGTYGTLPTATRYGYDFLGWYDQQSGGTKYESSTTVNITSNQILYAHWQVKNVVIKFNANNGSVSPTQKTVTYGATYGDLPTPTREGWKFAGWYTAASGGNKVTSSSTVDTISEITIFAHWNQEQILDGGIIKINNSGVLISVSQYKGSHSDVTKVMNSGGQEKASTANIVTGDHLLKGNKEYRVVVIGDVDGNGKTNTTDFARIWKHMDRADSFTFTDELQLLAADVDESGEVRAADYTKLWKMIKRG